MTKRPWISIRFLYCMKRVIGWRRGSDFKVDSGEIVWVFFLWERAVFKGVSRAAGCSVPASTVWDGASSSSSSSWWCSRRSPGPRWWDGDGACCGGSSWCPPRSPGPRWWWWDGVGAWDGAWDGRRRPLRTLRTSRAAGTPSSVRASPSASRASVGASPASACASPWSGGGAPWSGRGAPWTSCPCVWRAPTRPPWRRPTDQQNKEQKKKTSSAAIAETLVHVANENRCPLSLYVLIKSTWRFFHFERKELEEMMQ